MQGLFSLAFCNTRAHIQVNFKVHENYQSHLQKTSSIHDTRTKAYGTVMLAMLAAPTVDEFPAMTYGRSELTSRRQHRDLESPDGPNK